MQEVRKKLIAHLQEKGVLAKGHERLVITWPGDKRIEMVQLMIDFIEANKELIGKQ